MKISRRTQELMRIYALTNEEVCFAQLVAAGRTQLEAYCIAFHDQLITSHDSPQRASSELIHNRPNIATLTRSLQAFTTDSQQAKDKGKEAHKSATRKEKEKANITTKDGQLQELRKIYEETTDNKARADLLKQISDLQQLKHEQSTEEEQRVHYYLPIRCDICPYKPTKQPTEDGNSPEKVI